MVLSLESKSRRGTSQTRQPGGFGPPLGLHRFKAVGVKPANRQFVSAASKGDAEFAGVVSRDRVHTQGLHHRAPVDLPEHTGIELRQQVFQRGANQVLMLRSEHPKVLVGGFKYSTSSTGIRRIWLPTLT